MFEIKKKIGSIALNNNYKRGGLMKNFGNYIYVFATFLVASTFSITGYSQDEGGSNLMRLPN